jgi:hypothetical protein
MIGPGQFENSREEARELRHLWVSHVAHSPRIYCVCRCSVALMALAVAALVMAALAVDPDDALGLLGSVVEVLDHAAHDVLDAAGV